MPTARARFRNRPVEATLVGDQIERFIPPFQNPGVVPPPTTDALLLTTGDFLLLTDGSSHLLLAP